MTDQSVIDGITAQFAAAQSKSGLTMGMATQKSVEEWNDILTKSRRMCTCH